MLPQAASVPGNHWLASARNVSRLMLQEMAWAELLQKICEEVATHPDCLLVWFGQPEASTGRVLPLAVMPRPCPAWGAVEVRCDASATGQSPTGLAVRERRVVVFSEGIHDARMRPWQAALGWSDVAVLAAFPILAGDAVPAVLTVGLRQPGGLGREELQMLTELAEDLGQVWRNREAQAQQRQALHALEGSREHLLTLIEALPGVMFLKDGGGRWLLTNAAAKKMFRLEQRPWVGRTDAELAVDFPELAAIHQSCIASDEVAWEARRATKVTEYPPGPDGEPREYETFKLPLFTPDGRRQSLVIYGCDVTEKHRQEAELKFSELLARQSRDAILRIRTSDGRIMDANPAAVNSYGYSRAELLTMNVAELRADAVPAALVAQLQQADAQGLLFEAMHRRRTGELFPVEVSSQGMEYAGERYIISTIRDITERKQAEQAIRQAHDFYLQLLEVAPTLIWRADSAGERDWFNTAWLEFTGRTCAEEQGHGWTASIHPDDLEHFLSVYRGAFAQKTPFRLEYRLRRHDGAYRWVASNGRPFRSASGEFAGYIGYCFDIHDAKSDGIQIAYAKVALEQANALLETRVMDRTHELALSEKQHRDLIEHMVEGVAIFQVLFDDNTQIKDLLTMNANPAMIRLAGQAGLEGRRMSEAFPDLFVEQAQFLNLLRETCLTGVPQKSEVRRRRDGQWYSLNVFSTHHQQVVVMFDDISHHKQIQEGLIRSEAQVRQLIRKAPIPLNYVNLDGQFIYINDRFTQLFGYDATELRTVDDWWRLAYPDPKYRQLVQLRWEDSVTVARSQNSIVPLNEFRVTCKNGQVRSVEISAVFLEEGVLAVFVDQTEQRSAEALLRESEERWQYALNGAEDAVWDWDATTNKVFYSQQWNFLLGYGIGELVESYQESFRRIHPEDLPHVQARIQAHEYGRTDHYRSEHRVRCKDGSYKWILSRGKIIRRQRDGAVGRFIGTNTDISDQKQAALALEKAVAKEHFLAEVIENSDVGFCLGQADGELVMFNQAYADLTGYTREELLDQKKNWFLDLTPAEWRETEANFLAECQRTRQPVRYEKEYFRKDGRRIPIELSVQPTYDAAGDFLHYRAFITDITERRSAAKKLQQAVANAAQANQAKSEFLASMSHEIRTPMNAILGYTQLLQRDELVDASIKEKLAIINQSGENLLHILNDILDLAKIEAGRMSVVQNEFSILELCEELIQFFRTPAAAKNLTLTFVKQGEVFPNIRSDRDKIRNICVNLLGNALKFTRQGGVILQLRMQRGEGRAWRLEISVADTGPGIAPEELTRLFEKFEQGHAGKNQSGGTGLGLALCRQYASLLGGYIEANSEPGRGSNFWFEIPVEQAQDTLFIRQTKTPRRFKLPPAARPYRMLVVDDVGCNREFLLQLLKKEGFRTCTASSGHEALALCNAWTPDLVLMDTRMPGLSGYDTIRQLRANPAMAALKIITVSATAYPEDRQDALAAGANDFIAKPVQALELLQKIGEQLGLEMIPEPETPGELSTALETPASEVSLIGLPADWRKQLREAATMADFQLANQLIASIQPQHPQAAAALSQWAGRFDAEAILTALAAAESFSEP